MKDEFKTRCYFEMAFIKLYTGQVPKRFEVVGTRPNILILAVYDRDLIKPFPHVKAEVCITEESGEKHFKSFFESNNPEKNYDIYKIHCLDAKKEIHEQLDKYNKEEKNGTDTQNESD